MFGDFTNRTGCGKKLVIFLHDVVFWHLPEGPENNQENPLWIHLVKLTCQTLALKRFVFQHYSSKNKVSSIFMLNMFAEILILPKFLIADHLCIILNILQKT